MERQAFDARMTIDNAFPDVALDNVNITVTFKDADGDTVQATYDPNNETALFFMRQPDMTGINAISNGTIAADTIADIHWLIIPAPGAAASNLVGTLYYVGATLSYKIRTEEHTVEVTPDYIYVKPMPDLVLDYFLPGEVYGDDAFSDPIEPPVPFPLGLRIKNIGHGTAQKVKIDTGQPKIIDNEQGLLVGFMIQSSQVQGREVSPSLLMNYGDIAPQASVMGRWIMTVSLSGIFSEFTADISHADELGGRLTSLIDETNVHAHIHIHDVLVDAAGRDNVRDFLTTNMVVYESEGIDSPVADRSSSATLAGGGGSYVLSFSSVTQGFIYVKKGNPEPTNMVLQSVTRSDGKHINDANAWLSQSRDGESWDYFFNLFDVNPSNCTYAVLYQAVSSVDQAPVLAYIGPKTGYVTNYLGFVVSASDDGGAPELSTGPLPAGAEFTTGTNGSGLFGWTPTANQVGEYRIKFTAFDGTLADSETITLTILGEEPPPYPGWWLTRGVLVVGAPSTNDYAPVNLGQVKHIASMAWDELNALPGGAKFTLYFTNANNYAAVNIGQLKALATNFYGRLGMEYPWIGAPETNDWAIANIGQVKHLFSVDPTKDSDADGMPDWWEEMYPSILDPNNPADAGNDPDGDSRTNVQEYLADTNPTDL